MSEKNQAENKKEGRLPRSYDTLFSVIAKIVRDGNCVTALEDNLADDEHPVRIEWRRKCQCQE